ncbi:aldolase [Acrocarpospora pleiomorpha]|uniref:Aldolase n=1 Tax=Acrocarpospora pleiomorpha TaxID=90975 RepID=A0A5M3XLR2_9ACTN|nr:aldolase/citrate lyase family protein [Acrocarpospora pleiomorpha]GES21059.1 aldolase [Acrocarpospora pleiomorpha]
MRMLERLRGADRCLVGTWVKIPALETVELLARAGFDFVVVDMEHSPISLESAYRAVVVAQGLGVHALVRVPDAGGSHLQRVLDIGADGILVPHVTGRADAERAMSGMIFPPHGTRGSGSTSRAGAWGLDGNAEYVRRGNEETLRIPQLEDLSALEEVEEILDTPGLNGVFLGMGDLTLSTGLKADDPGLRRHVDRLLAGAKARGLPCGVAARDAAAAQEAARDGFSFVMISNDASIFGRAAAELRAATGPLPLH